jgi:membrane fusion protein, epimerase transport system
MNESEPLKISGGPPLLDGKAGPMKAPAAAAGPDEASPQTSDRFPRWFGFIVILLAFGFGGGWAALAPIDGAVVAFGTVTVDSYRKGVQHLEGGIVRSILVRDGDHVDRDQLLVQLDDTGSRASYLVAYNRYLGELGRLARLEAELQGFDTIVFPDRLTQDVAGEGRAARVMATEEREFHSRREAIQGEIAVLRQRQEQISERIAGMQAQRQARLRSIASLKEELASRGRLAERELLPAAELRPLERQLAEAEGEAGELQATIAAARIESGETELRIIQLGYDFQREVTASLRETSTIIDSLEEELRALEDVLRRKEIRAPVAGEVVNLRVHSEWAVIGSGETILDLVPGDEALVVEARVRPQDIDSVSEGMLADVRFTAFSFRTTPVVEGEVVFVSADSLKDPATGENYFLTRIVVSEEAMRQLGPVSLRPGMPADVMIKTGERTPLEYLLKPLTDALARSWTEN